MSCPVDRAYHTNAATVHSARVLISAMPDIDTCSWASMPPRDSSGTDTLVGQISDEDGGCVLSPCRKRATDRPW